MELSEYEGEGEDHEERVATLISRRTGKLPFFLVFFLSQPVKSGQTIRMWGKKQKIVW